MTDVTDRIRDLSYAIENYGLDGAPGPRTIELMTWARDEIASLRREVAELQKRIDRPASRIGSAIRDALETGDDTRFAGLAERTADAPRSYPAGATSTSHPSLPSRFRSRLYYEREGWDAHVKVDYDAKNPLSIERVRSVAGTFPAWFLGSECVLRTEVYRSSRKANHHHLRVWFRPEMARLPAGAILGIQEMLGDDPTRVKLNAERVARDEPGWNVLWQEKFVNGVSASREVLDEDLTREVERILCSKTKTKTKKTKRGAAR